MRFEVEPVCIAPWSRDVVNLFFVAPWYRSRFPCLVIAAGRVFPAKGSSSDIWRVLACRHPFGVQI